MEAVKSHIGEIFRGDRQFMVPVYQRKYSWELAQCRRLWSDMLRMQKNNQPGHFVGSIVNIAEAESADGVQRFMVIDGQQRMATLTLLLVALRDYLMVQKHLVGDELVKEITSAYLVNTSADGPARYKLLLSQTDKEIMASLIDRKPRPHGVASRLLDTYHYFSDRLRSEELEPGEVLEAVKKLHIVNITLDRVDDDPQLIFESLNSTGLDLSQSDLIRNYVLMGLEPDEQADIYRTVWYPMECLFEYSRQTALMDRFLRDYLTMQLGRIPKVDKVYDAFKDLYPTRRENARALCESIYHYARFYTNLYYCKSEDGKWDAAFRDIKALQMEVSYPFLLRVYSDCVAGKISEEEFSEVLRLCESYVLRRAICEIPTNSLNKTFATIKNEIDEKHYMQSIKAYFLTRESYKEFPPDRRFVASFRQKDVYNMRVRNYILAKLEEAGGGKRVGVDNYNIEHILPPNPNLSLEWRRMLGPDWKRIQRGYMNTIGNLALVTYSGDKSDRPIADKLQLPGGILQTDTYLNSTVGKPPVWDEDTIGRRSELLAELALSIWQMPQMTKRELTPYLDRDRGEQYSAANYDFNAFTKILFEHMDQRVMQLSQAIKRDYKKQHIAYRYETNFAEVVVQKSRLRLVLNLLSDEVSDPAGICRMVTTPSKWTPGEVEIYYESLEQLPAVMNVLQQALQKQAEL